MVARKVAVTLRRDERKDAATLRSAVHPALECEDSSSLSLKGDFLVATTFTLHSGSLLKESGDKSHALHNSAVPSRLVRPAFLHPAQADIGKLLSLPLEYPTIDELLTQPGNKCCRTSQSESAARKDWLMMINRRNILGSRCSAGGIRILCLVATVAIALPGPATGDDWPTYRHDNSRSAVTEESLAMPLTDSWSFKPLHAPQPAWGEPNPRPVGGWYGDTELRRVHFDDAYQVTAANGAVYFGSSADGKVVSLDGTTGQPRWSFMTGGPIRLAPTLWNDNVYAASDDGFVYCLNTGDGHLKWKFRAAPSDRKVLGNGKPISLWPIRTGVLVDDGIAYFAAGIYPAEGIYLYAVGAEDGNLIWCNDSCAATPQSRISPQGYMLASEDRLFTPLGRVSPAAFDRKDGRLLYEAYIEHIIGGTYAMLDGSQLFTGTQQLIGYDQASHRSQTSWFWGHRLIVTPEMFYVATGNELYAVKRKEYSPPSLVRKDIARPEAFPHHAARTGQARRV